MISSIDIVDEAKSWLGTRYCHRASLKKSGCDCLGLVRGVWRELYGNEPETLPPYTPDWAARTGRNTLLEGALRHLDERPIEAAAPGDVILFKTHPNVPPNHMGILISGSHFVHARSNHGVIRAPWKGWWRERTEAVFSFPRELT